MISESFTRIDTPANNSGTYSEITQLSTGLYRAKRRGKYFILKGAKSKDPRSLNLLKREYDLCANLSHPHIVTIFTFEEETPIGPAIVMEYVDGRTLKEYLESNPKKSERQRVFLQLLEAVGYIHRSGLLHNDLKPQNIVITNKDNDLKIIDFGLSDDDSNYLEKNLGATEQYASPELLRYRNPNNQSDILLDSRSDIFSIGKIIQDIFPNNYKSIRAKCTKEDVNQRYTNIDELKRAWNNRNRIFHLAAAVALIVLILIPVTLFLKERKKFSNANATISALSKTTDSLLKETNTIIKTTNSIKQESNAFAEQRNAERKKEARFNHIKDSLIQLIEKKYKAVYDKSLVRLNKQWEVARSGEGGDPLGSKFVYLPGEDWKEFWSVDGATSKIDEKIKPTVNSLSLDAKQKSLLIDLLHNRSTRLCEELYQELYSKSYDKYNYDYLISHR